MRVFAYESGREERKDLSLETLRIAFRCQEIDLKAIKGEGKAINRQMLEGFIYGLSLLPPEKIKIICGRSSQDWYSILDDVYRVGHEEGKGKDFPPNIQKMAMNVLKKGGQILQRPEGGEFFADAVKKHHYPWKLGPY